MSQNYVLNYIRIFANGQWFTIDNSKVFSGGEVHVNVSHLPAQIYDGFIKARVQSSDDLMQLLMVGDALKRKYNKMFPILLPYMPYARQDRVCARGDALSIRHVGMMLKLITNRVYTWDIHSTAAADELHIAGIELISKSQTEIFKQSNLLSLLMQNKNLLLVSPDKGALEKTRDLADEFGIASSRIVECKKVRDSSTGELSGFSFDTHNSCTVEGKDLLIVDDICDGGGTFLGIGEMLQEANPKSLSLYVTHGIFSKGVSMLGTMFNKIYTTDSFNRLDSGKDCVTIIKV